MAETLLDEFATYLPGGVQLVPGSGGMFDVKLGNRLLFSKSREHRFPQPAEVERTLGRLLRES